MRPWWQGFVRLNILVVPDGLIVKMYDGLQETSVGSDSYAAAIPTKPYDIRVRRAGAELVLYIDYMEVGRFAINDFFSSGMAYNNLTVAPGDQLILHKLTVETPGSNAENVELISFFNPGIQPGSDVTLQFLAEQHNLKFGTFMELWNFNPEQSYSGIAVN